MKQVSQKNKLASKFSVFANTTDSLAFEKRFSSAKGITENFAFSAIIPVFFAEKVPGTNIIRKSVDLE